MTVNEAKRLNKGDIVFYNNLQYKVLSTKECRAADTNEIYVSIKCKRQNETLWLNNKLTKNKEQPTHWTLGYSLDAELGFRDGKYLPRKAALILYPEYFDENGEPIFNMLPIGKSKR